MVLIPTNRVAEHPGEFLAELLEDYEMSANALARAVRVPPNRITAILNGERGITTDTVLRLARYFSMSPEFWMNAQMTHDLSKANMDEQLQASIARDVQPRELALA